MLEYLPEVDVLVELLDLSGAGGRDGLLKRVGERPRGCSAAGLVAVVLAGTAVARRVRASSGFAGAAASRGRVGWSDDLPVGASGFVEAVELPVGDPDDPGVQVVERREVFLAEHRTPHRPERVEHGRLDDPIVRAGLQVDGRAAGEVARQRLPRNCRGHHLLGERGQDHVGDSHLQRATDEPATQRVGRELADAVGFHARLFEQPTVDGELPVGRVA